MDKWLRTLCPRDGLGTHPRAILELLQLLLSRPLLRLKSTDWVDSIRVATLLVSYLTILNRFGANGLLRKKETDIHIEVFNMPQVSKCPAV